jgi:putative oxidoreductase
MVDNPFTSKMPGIFSNIAVRNFNLMKKLFNTNYTDAAFNFSMLLIRAGFGFLLFFIHGLSKLQNFDQRKDSFADPLGVGHMPSLLFTIFAEVFCALLLVFGLLSRLAALALVIFFGILILVYHKHDPLKQKEMAILFLLAFLAILFCGPGKWSLDKLIGK